MRPPLAARGFTRRRKKIQKKQRDLEQFPPHITFSTGDEE
jgi:hypothetical protein